MQLSKRKTAIQRVLNKRSVFLAFIVVFLRNIATKDTL
jgi:hypothetical protein